ncbi:MAG: phosphotransferase [Pseudomonadota bacterium]
MGLWGIEAPLIPLPGGHRNHVFRAGSYVLKSTRRSAAALAWLGPLHTAAEAAGLVAPRLIPSTRGNISEAGWTCEPFIAGTPGTKADLAALPLAALHRATATLPQRPGFTAAADLVAREAAGDVDLSAMPSDLADACHAAWEALAPLPRAAIHGDISPHNLIRTPEGRLALIDWDEARCDATVFDTGSTDPAIARALTAWEIAVCWDLEPERAGRLASGFAPRSAP